MNIKTITEFSAGGIVLNHVGKDAKIILISRKKEGLASEVVWCLPKGKIEKSEKPQQAALREVREETEVKAEVIKEIGKINYWYYKKKGVRCYKTVYFYIMRLKSGKIGTESFEVNDVKWFKIDDAISNMSYNSEIEMVKKVKHELERQVELKN